MGQLFLLSLLCILQKYFKKTPPIMDLRSCCYTGCEWRHFVRLGNFFNSEIIGNVTTPFGIDFKEIILARKMLLAAYKVNPNDAYNAIANDPKFAILEQVPVKHPTQLYFAYILYLLHYFSCIGR
jgi:prolipoprotein diacylglyceryltransferase